MSKISIRNGTGTTKYDAHHKVLSQTYGAFADLRRELSDRRQPSTGREDILKSFATCPDSQRSWLLLEDYFEKLSLSRRDFPDTHWWPRLLNAQGKARLEELAFLFSAPNVPCRPNCRRTPAPTVSPGPRKPRRNKISSRNSKTGCRRPRCRCSTRRAPRCASSAACNRTTKSRHVTAWPCNFFCCARAPAKRRARCGI